MGMEFVRFVDMLGYEFAAENFIAHFSSDEQASVRMVFQTHEHNIKLDLGLEEEITVEHVAEMSMDERLELWANTIPSNV